MTMLHIASSAHKRGRVARSLCNLWGAQTVVTPGWASKGKKPKEACPACVRLWNGGKR